MSFARGRGAEGVVGDGEGEEEEVVSSPFPDRFLIFSNYLSRILCFLLRLLRYVGFR